MFGERKDMFAMPTNCVTTDSIIPSFDGCVMVQGNKEVQEALNSKGIQYSDSFGGGVL